MRKIVASVVIFLLFAVAAFAAEDPRVVFKMAREICKKEIAPAEVVQLLANGRTELIEGFTSKRGSAFAAYLVLSKKKDRSEFEFPER